MNRRKPLRRERSRFRAEGRPLWFYIGAAAVVGFALIVLVLAVLWMPAEVGESAPPLANCSPIQTVTDQGRNHLQPGQGYDYGGSNPPSSGPHDPQPCPPGVYDNPIAVTQEVHNLEHGYIIIHYKGISTTQVQQLASLAEQDPRKLIISPFPSMSFKVSLTAWDHLQTCDGVDPRVIKSFIGEFRDKGPEQTPM